MHRNGSTLILLSFDKHLPFLSIALHKYHTLMLQNKVRVGGDY